VTDVGSSPETKWVVGSLALQLLPLSYLRLAKRTRFWLQLNGITTVADLADFSEQDLLRIPCFSTKSLAVVKEQLELNGTKLRDNSNPRGAVARGWREGFAVWSTQALTGLACALAGPRRAHLRGAWGADLYGDPEQKERPPGWHRFQLAMGFVVAAIRCRFDDAAQIAWRPVDRLLASWAASTLAMLMPLAAATVVVLTHGGIYGIVSNAENLSVTGALPYLAIKALRRYRQIRAPRRPRKDQRNQAH